LLDLFLAFDTMTVQEEVGNKYADFQTFAVEGVEQK